MSEKNAPLRAFSSYHIGDWPCLVVLTVLTSVTVDRRTLNAERRTPNAERRTPNVERRTSNTERRTSNIEHRTSNAAPPPQAAEGQRLT
ncbi:MAG: hypothetical protein LBJ64_13145 [Deltaproteobacteria bacterium]|nr:hypothetical protein [Deltaproteobacteria bacterium]